MIRRFPTYHRAFAIVALAAAVLFIVSAAHAANRQWTDPTSKKNITSQRDRLPSSSAASLAVAPEARSLNNASGSARNTDAGVSQTLVFTVDGSATITDSQGNTTSVADFRDPVSGGGINEAHILVTGDGAPNDLYLLIYNFDEGGHSYLDPEVNYAYFDDFNSSRNLQADISSYISQGYSLELQLGFYNENNDTFTLLATATSPLSELLGHYTYEGSSLAPPSQAWTPDFIAAPGVPEPASGVLALLGALALFRRRRPRT